MPATAEERAFWAAILAAPADDLPRLVYADYLEENGRAERAEFIRLQCDSATGTPEVPGGSVEGRLRAIQLLTAFGDEWIGGDKIHHRWRGFHADNDASAWNPDRRTDVSLTWHRGFVVKVRCPIAWFAGTRCVECEGLGFTVTPGPRGEGIACPCVRCDGDWIDSLFPEVDWEAGTLGKLTYRPGRGYVNANGPKLLLGRHPLAEVEITDRRPFADRWWYDEAERTGTGRMDDPESDLPTWVFDRLRQPLDGKDRPADAPWSRKARPYSPSSGADPTADMTQALLSLPPEDL